MPKAVKAEIGELKMETSPVTHNSKTCLKEKMLSNDKSVSQCIKKETRTKEPRESNSVKFGRDLKTVDPQWRRQMLSSEPRRFHAQSDQLEPRQDIKMDSYEKGSKKKNDLARRNFRETLRMDRGTRVLGYCPARATKASEDTAAKVTMTANSSSHRSQSTIECHCQGHPKISACAQWNRPNLC